MLKDMRDNDRHIFEARDLATQLWGINVDVGCLFKIEECIIGGDYNIINNTFSLRFGLFIKWKLILLRVKNENNTLIQMLT